MDTLIYLKAVLLGIVEGATEFLPVSSTGHLIIVGSLLGFTGEFSKTFDIFIQLGAIMAIVWHYRQRIILVLRGMAGGEERSVRLVVNIGIAFLPAAVLGLILHHYIKLYLFNPISVAGALIVGGIIILLIEGRHRPPQIATVDDMTWRDALKIGLAQTAALFPGVSRAGATIMGGLLSGLSRPAATEFSFFLAIPTMFSATLYDLYKSRDTWQGGNDVLMLAVGFVCAFVSASIVVKAFLHFVGRHDFKVFAYYRIVFGTLVLLLGTTGIVRFAAA